jgi:hypothetical protein
MRFSAGDRLRKVTSYTELDTVLTRRTGLTDFDFSLDKDRAAMGHLLCLMVEHNRPETGVMISALVHYLNAIDAGPGFYALLRDVREEDGRQVRASPRGAAPPGSSPGPRGLAAAGRLEFWVQQLNAIHDYYANGREASAE